MDYSQFTDKLEQCYSAVFADVMDGLGYRNQCMDPKIRPLTAEMVAWGEAVTIYLEATDEIAERPYELSMTQIDELTPGQIIVAQCDREEPVSFWGGLLSNAALGHGSHGVIIDGGTRDYREIVELGFPVFSSYLSPLDSLGRVDATKRDVPILCGGIEVNPGDLIFGDVDGVVVVPQAIAKEVIQLAWEKVQGENTVRDELRDGASVTATFAKYGIL